jgi:hypothetical protein
LHVAPLGQSPASQQLFSGMHSSLHIFIPFAQPAGSVMPEPLVPEAELIEEPAPARPVELMLAPAEPALPSVSESPSPSPSLCAPSPLESSPDPLESEPSAPPGPPALPLLPRPADPPAPLEPFEPFAPPAPALAVPPLPVPPLPPSAASPSALSSDSGSPSAESERSPFEFAPASATASMVFGGRGVHEHTRSVAIKLERTSLQPQIMSIPLAR